MWPFKELTEAAVLKNSIEWDLRSSFGNLPVFLLCAIGSFFLVAFGQPAWVPGFGMLASAGGYALFWVAMFRFPSRWQRFLFTVFWYIGVEAVHLSWMTSMQYMGPLILIVQRLLERRVPVGGKVMAWLPVAWRVWQWAAPYLRKTPPPRPPGSRR